MRYLTLPVLAALALGGAAFDAHAQTRGDWALGLGVHQVNPQSGNGRLAGGTLPLDVGSDTNPTVSLEYFVYDNLGVEVLAAWPFEHDIGIQGLGHVGSTKHLPPTLTLQYHFNSAGRVSPFVGAGLNYTTFFSEKTTGALAGSDLKLGDSWGLAAHVGVDFAVTGRNAVRVDARWMDIDSRVHVDGADLGTAHLDPLTYGVAWVLKF